jgi:hypothetical protein
MVGNDERCVMNEELVSRNATRSACAAIDKEKGKREKVEDVAVDLLTND